MRGRRRQFGGGQAIQRLLERKGEHACFSLVFDTHSSSSSSSSKSRKYYPSPTTTLSCSLWSGMPEMMGKDSIKSALYGGSSLLWALSQPTTTVLQPRTRLDGWMDGWGHQKILQARAPESIIDPFLRMTPRRTRVAWNDDSLGRVTHDSSWGAHG